MGGVCSSILDEPAAPAAGSAPENFPQQQQQQQPNHAIVPPAQSGGLESKEDAGGAADASGYESDSENINEARRIKFMPAEEKVGVEVGAVRPWIGAFFLFQFSFHCYHQPQSASFTPPFEIMLYSIPAFVLKHPLSSFLVVPPFC